MLPKIQINVPVVPAVGDRGGNGAVSAEEAPDTPEILNTIVNMQQQQQQQQQQQTSSSPFLTVPTSKSYWRPQPPKPEVDDFRSQLIKEGLKLKVQQKLTSTVANTKPDSRKRRHSYCVGEGAAAAATATDVATCKKQSKRFRTKSEEGNGEEADDKKLRRRARNKIAATKCREKKKIRAQMLVKV